MTKIMFTISLIFLLGFANFVLAEIQPLGPGPTSCNEPSEIWDYQLKKCVPSTSTTPGGPAINCPSGCVCNGNTVTCPTQSETITTPIQSGTVTSGGSSGTTQIQIGKTSSGTVSIKQGKVEATTTQKLNVMESKVYMETSSGVKEVKILPEEASSKATAVTEVGAIELKEESQQPIYSVKGTKQAKLLFVIPVSMQIETKVNAESGNVISVKKPWWSFLAW